MVNKKVQWRFLACILFSQYRKTFKLNLVLVMFLELFVFFSSLTSFINCFYNHNLQNPFKTSTGKRKYSSVLQFFKWFFQIAKLSRSLRVPGDTGNKGKTERKLTPNLNASVKTEAQIPNQVSTTPTYQAEQGGNQEELDDDLEEGGLC